MTIKQMITTINTEIKVTINQRLVTFVGSTGFDFNCDWLFNSSGFNSFILFDFKELIFDDWSDETDCDNSGFDGSDDGNFCAADLDGNDDGNFVAGGNFDGNDDGNLVDGADLELTLVDLDCDLLDLVVGFNDGGNLDLDLVLELDLLVVVLGPFGGLVVVVTTLPRLDIEDMILEVQSWKNLKEPEPWKNFFSLIR